MPWGQSPQAGPWPSTCPGTRLTHAHLEPPRPPHDTTASLPRARPGLWSARAFSQGRAPAQARWTVAGVALGPLPCQEGASASLSRSCLRSCPRCLLVPSASARWPPRRRVPARRPPRFSLPFPPPLSGRGRVARLSGAASSRPPHRCRRCGRSPSSPEMLDCFKNVSIRIASSRHQWGPSFLRGRRPVLVTQVSLSL